EAEQYLPYAALSGREFEQRRSPAEAIARSTVIVAEELMAASIVAATRTGYTARMIARHRPRIPVLAVTPSAAVATRLCIVWGVTPRQGTLPSDTDEIFQAAIAVV